MTTILQPGLRVEIDAARCRSALGPVPPKSGRAAVRP
jgi:hypothetical protein